MAPWWAALRASLTLIAEHPVLGFGPGSARELMWEATLKDGGKPLGYSHFHNFALDALVRSGLFGLIALAAIFVIPLTFALKRRTDPISRFGLAMLVVIDVTYMMSGTLGIMFHHDILDALFVYSLAVACFLVFGEDEAEAETVR